MTLGTDEPIIPTKERLAALLTIAFQAVISSNELNLSWRWAALSPFGIASLSYMGLHVCRMDDTTVTLAVTRDDEPLLAGILEQAGFGSMTEITRLLQLNDAQRIRLTRPA